MFVPFVRLYWRIRPYRIKAAASGLSLGEARSTRTGPPPSQPPISQLTRSRNQVLRDAVFPYDFCPALGRRV